MEKPWSEQVQDWLVEARRDMRPQRLRIMHQMYGKAEGEMCGTCIHLESHRHNRTNYFKCDLTRITCGPGTDWRKKWPACGMHDKRTKPGDQHGSK